MLITYNATIFFSFKFLKTLGKIEILTYKWMKYLELCVWRDLMKLFDKISYGSICFIKLFDPKFSQTPKLLWIVSCLFILIITTFLYIYYFTCLCISIEQQTFLLNRAAVVISFSSFDNSMYVLSTEHMQGTRSTKDWAVSRGSLFS